MNRLLPPLLLVLGLIVPVSLFLLLLAQPRLGLAPAALVSVLAGWAINVGWALATRRQLPEAGDAAAQNTLAIALRFGWLCPALMVLVAWAV